MTGVIVLYTLGSVTIVSLLSLLGAFIISIDERRLRELVFALVSIAIGALLGDAFIHLLPDAFKNIPQTSYVSLSIIAGILFLFILEKYLHIQHEHENVHTDVGCEDEDKHDVTPVGKLILISGAFHNGIDGILIGISYLAGIPIGIATTLAIVFHEIPREISDFGVLLFAGYTRKKALLYNFLTALFAIAGALLVLFFGSRIEAYLGWFLAFGAGMFIYIAAADLVPELHKRREFSGALIEIIGILLGVCIMYLLLFIE